MAALPKRKSEPKRSHRRGRRNVYAVDLTTNAGVQRILDAWAASRSSQDMSGPAALARLKKLGIVTKSGRLARQYAAPKT